MISRSQPVRGILCLVVVSGLLGAFAFPAAGQRQAPSTDERAAEESPDPNSGESEGTAPVPAADQQAEPAPVLVQTGLPRELVLDPEKLSEERQQLEAASVYLLNNAPPGGIGGFLSRASGWVSRKLSGVRDPRPMTIEAILAAQLEGGQQLNGVLVTVEGLYEVGEDNDSLVTGPYRLAVGRLADTVEEGFGPPGPNGLPAAVSGTVLSQEQGLVLHMKELSPAPNLTRARLARLYELHDNAADYQRAVESYSGVSSPSPWYGFAMARGGYVAEERLRNRKKAISLYQQAWQYEGQIKAGKAPTRMLPKTWVQGSDGAWTESALRESIGERLDALNGVGFWYKFVNFFVVASGKNAGIGLILMAIITRLLLWPLTRKQIQSSRAMQRLQPQIKALQQKHGKDKQKFQADFWKLCKANKVNPLGGCLPLLVQLPVLWMVYRGIRAYTVQLADHSFLWIGNLADPDLPLLVLYTISMIAFQKLTMKNQPVADPQQQQQQNMMVWMMPIMFFMFFQTIASGFILYWLGTNLIYLPQQYLGTRGAKEEGSEAEAEPKERVTTIEPQQGSDKQSDGKQATESPSWLTRLRSIGNPKDDGNGQAAPQSYEEKKRDAKKSRRGSSRRRRRRS